MRTFVEEEKQCVVCGRTVQDDSLDYCDFCLDIDAAEFDGFWYGSAR